MKNIFIFFWICLNLIFLIGCWDRVEINDIALIQGVGIDRKDSGNLEVIVQLVSPKMMSAGQAGGGEGSETLTRSGEGKTLADAVSNLQEKLPRRVFWSHTKVIVLGGALAEERIRENIDFFLRHPQPRMRSYVFVTKEDVKDVLALLPSLEQSTAEVLWKFAGSKTLMNVTLKDFVLMLHGDGGAAVLPLIGILPPEKGAEPLQTIAYSNSTAIFKEGKMIGTINDEDTREVLWLKGDFREATVTVRPDEEKMGGISVRIIQSNTELLPKIEEGKWKMNIHMDLNAEMIQNETNLNVLNPKLSSDLEHELATDVEKRIQSMLEKIQKEKKADILGFGELFHQKYPQEWKRVKDHWDDEVFPEVEVTFHTRADIRSGMVTSPPSFPEKEVEK